MLKLLLNDSQDRDYTYGYIEIKKCNQKQLQDIIYNVYDLFNELDIEIVDNNLFDYIKKCYMWLELEYYNFDDTVYY